MIRERVSRSRILVCVIALILLVSLIIPAVSCGKSESTTPTKTAASSPTPTPTPVKPITLVMSTHEPNAGIMYDKFWKPWMDEIEKRTGGRILIEGHFNGELAGPPDAWDVLINKTVDISYVHLNNLPDKFPMTDFVGFTTYSLVNQQLGKELLELYNKYPEMQDELKEVHLMMLASTYWTSFAGTKPIHTLEDMQGMKVTGVGKWQNKRVEALGLVPVSMGPMDILPSLQTGVIDNGPNGTLPVAIDFGWLDFLPYWTHVRTECIPLIIGMNLDVWNSLPVDIQKILDDMVSWTTDLWDNMFQDAEIELIPEVIAQVKEVYTPSDAELARWNALDKPVWDEFAAELESKGLPGKQLMADHVALEQKYSIPLSEWKSK
jgi:TRAP-type C4-dicarboxylate transport system substrate-binding protein